MNTLTICICRSPLQAGDSGSILYTQENGELYALGMVIGKEKERDNVYRAVVLSQALKQLERLYPHAASGLSEGLFSCRR